MSWRTSLICLLAACVLAGCGYGFSGKQAPSVLAPGSTLAISKIEHPTMDASLEHTLRRLLREELGNRGLAQWADEDAAQALLNVTVRRLLSRSEVKDQEDVTLRSYLEIHLDAEIRRSADKTLLWRSGPLSVRWSYTGDEAAARREVLVLAVRELADRMRQAY